MNIGLGKKSFTLTELLIVISILAVLVSLLSPALKNALVTARKMTCLNNQKSLVQAILSYAGDNGDYFPVQDYGSSSNTNPGTNQTNRKSWDHAIFEYVGLKTEIYTCPGQIFPSAQASSITINSKIYTAQLSYMTNGVLPSRTIGDSRSKSPMYVGWSTQVFKMRPDTFLLMDQKRGDSYRFFGRDGYKDIRHLTLSNHNMEYCNFSSVDGSSQSNHLLDMLDNEDFSKPSLPIGDECEFSMAIDQFRPIGRFNGF